MVKLVLIRHGQSVWNLENRFTGWADVALSKKGILEAKNAGRKLKDFKFDAAYTSELMRAQMTLFEILNINNNDNKFFKAHLKDSVRYNKFFRKQKELNYIKLTLAEQLNERDYGDLEGLNKLDTAKKFGDEQVHIWRRSYDVAPPGGECLKDTYKRAVPYYKKVIEKDLKKNKNVIIAAHGNSLRAIIKYIEKISDKDIVNLEIKTGTPLVFDFDENLNVISKTILE